VITLLVMTDGRKDCLLETLASFEQMVAGPIERRIIHDDSGDPAYRSWLSETFAPDFAVIGGARAGFGGAIHRAWNLLAHTPEQFVFHLEDDFTFNRPIDLADLAEVLDQHPHLVQIALRRQPWNDEEKAAGGIVEQHPGDYTEVSLNGFSWLEHRRFFTTNPSLYRTDLCRGGWPDVGNSEGIFTHQLLADPEVRFGFWGSRDSGEWVTHIGQERVGTGYW
jgi:hypothetical protein